MSVFYKILKSLYLWITPITIVIFSLAYNLPNVWLHKQILQTNKFYDKFSASLQSGTKPDTVQGLIFKSLSGDLITPSWTQNVTEKNLDNFGNWLLGNNSQFTIYIPTKEVDKALGGEVSKELENKDNSKEIPTCSSQQTEDIKNFGFKLDSNLCLPENIKNESQKISDFWGAKQSEIGLDKVLADSPINKNTENYNAYNLLENVSGAKQMISALESIKGIFAATANNFVLFWGVLTGLFLALILLGKLSGKEILAEARFYTKSLSYSTFGLSFAVFVTLAGSMLLTNTVNNLLFKDPLFAETKNLLIIQLSWLVLGLLSTALIFTLFSLSGNLLLQLAVQTRLGSKQIQKKNQRLQQYQPKEGPNQTLDGQFEDKIESCLRNQTSNGLYEPNIGSEDYAQEVVAYDETTQSPKDSSPYAPVNTPDYPSYTYPATGKKIGIDSINIPSQRKNPEVINPNQTDIDKGEY